MNTSNRIERARTTPSDVGIRRERTQETAQRLSLIAIRNWEKALGGIVALPAAAALSTAATVLFGVSIIERTFELLDSSLSDIGRRVTEDADGQGEARRLDQPS
jgi:hypothetical protein